MKSWVPNKAATFFFFLAAQALVYCKKETPAPPDLGYGYWPIEEGHWVEYTVDSIVYNDFTDSAEHYAFQLKDVIAETFDDLEGRPTQRVERFRRANDTAEWKLVATYVTNRLVNSAQCVEDNVRYVKLKFPPLAGEDWNGNATNALGEEEFSYDYTDRPETVGGVAFDKVLRVIQQNDTDNFVIKTFSEERYAHGAGLVYKRYFYIETQFEVDSGLQFIQVVKDWGRQ